MGSRNWRFIISSRVLTNPNSHRKVAGSCRLSQRRRCASTWKNPNPSEAASLHCPKYVSMHRCTRLHIHMRLRYGQRT